MGERQAGLLGPGVEQRLQLGAARLALGLALDRRPNGSSAVTT